MAVRHGYGKIAGADALVFAYDTGDTKNSYKGEPTENIVSTMGYAGFYGTSPALTQLGPDHYRLSVGGHNSGLYYSMGVQTGTWTMSYDYKAIQGDPFLGGHVDGSYVAFYVDGVQANSSSTVGNLRSIANDGEWHRIHRVVANTNSTRNGGIFIQITRGGAASYPAIAEIRNVQIENKTKPTQYAGPSGTRSATQGLLDLTGNSSIDLTNAGFDSNAQIDFDGTDDYIIAGEEQFRFGNTFSLEFIMDWDGVDHTNDNLLGKRNGPDDGYAQYSVFVNNGNQYSGGTGKVLSFFGRTDGANGDVFMTYDLGSTTGYRHVCITVGSSSQSMYVNGVEVDTSNTNLAGRTYNITAGGARDFLIGAVRDNLGTGILNAANIDIPVVKA
jgi:hypothetical protein